MERISDDEIERVYRAALRCCPCRESKNEAALIERLRITQAALKNAVQALGCGVLDSAAAQSEYIDQKLEQAERELLAEGRIREVKRGA